MEYLNVSAFSLAPELSISNASNVETPDFLSSNAYDESFLFHAALANLKRVSVLINSQHIHPSLISIERHYQLKSPLINLFSDLHHNPKSLVGSHSKDLTVIQHCSAILHKHSKVDQRLFSEINKRFALQVNSFKIDTSEVAARLALHSSPLLLMKWFTMPDKYDLQTVARLTASSLNNICNSHQELTDQIVRLVLSWQVLTPEFRQEIARFAYDKYSLSSTFNL